MSPIKSIFEYEGLRIELTCSTHTLTNVVEAMENVLRGAGFIFKGSLDIVEDENV